MSGSSKLNSLREKAIQYFKRAVIDDNVIGLPHDEYTELTKCVLCGRELHRRSHLFNDKEEGIAAAGKRCPYCGTIYTTHRVIYVLVSACSPGSLILQYSWPVVYGSFRPRRGWVDVVNRDDVIYIEGKHSDSLQADNQKEKQVNAVLDKEYYETLNGSVKQKPNKKQNTKKSEITINDYPVIRISSVVVIDDESKYKSENYAIQVMSKVTGKIFAMIIEAEYKSESGHYFISKETYNKLFINGIPLCRLIKKRDYVERMSENNLDLKPQSVLMDYGYNVSDQNNLSMLARHNILAMLIDSGICRKERVISYLKFFIHQRQSKNNMHDAISKWEDDIDFVICYKPGTLKKTWTNNLEIRGL